MNYQQQRRKEAAQKRWMLLAAVAAVAMLLAVILFVALKSGKGVDDVAQLDTPPVITATEESTTAPEETTTAPEETTTAPEEVVETETAPEELPTEAFPNTECIQELEDPQELLAFLTEEVYETGSIEYAEGSFQVRYFCRENPYGYSVFEADTKAEAEIYEKLESFSPFFVVTPEMGSEKYIVIFRENL